MLRVYLPAVVALAAGRAPARERGPELGARETPARMPADATTAERTGAAAEAATALDAAAPAAPAQADAGPWTPLGTWGVEVAAPTAALHHHDAAAGRHRIELAYEVLVILEHVARPAPASLDAAVASLGTQRDLVEHAAAVTSAGVLYAIRTFDVRTGRRTAEGANLHYWIPITRVHAWLPLDAGHHVRCTGYLEHGVTSLADSPSLQALAAVCLSMRVAP